MRKIVGNIGFVDLPARGEDKRAGLHRVRAHGGVAPECLMPGVPFLQLRSGMQRERAGKYRDVNLFASPIMAARTRVNVQQAAHGTQQVSSNITDVQRGASETGSAPSQVLSAAQSLSGDSNRLRLEGTSQN